MLDLPNRWSDVEHESMNVCATTDKHESTIIDLCTSNTKFGFLIKFTQNLKFLKGFFRFKNLIFPLFEVAFIVCE